MQIVHHQLIFLLVTWISHYTETKIMVFRSDNQIMKIIG